MPLIVARQEKSVFSKKKLQCKSPSSAVVSQHKTDFRAFCMSFVMISFGSFYLTFFLLLERKNIKLHGVGNDEDLGRVAEGENIKKSTIWKNV